MCWKNRKLNVIISVSIIWCNVVKSYRTTLKSTSLFLSSSSQLENFKWLKTWIHPDQTKNACLFLPGGCRRWCRSSTNLEGWWFDAWLLQILGKILTPSRSLMHPLECECVWKLDQSTLTERKKNIEKVLVWMGERGELYKVHLR